MNLTCQDLSARMALAMLIPDTAWIVPDLARFGEALPGNGDTERGVPYRLRVHLGLTSTPADNSHRPGTVLIERCDTLGCSIARLRVRLGDGYRFLWRRFPVDVSRASLIAAAAEEYAGAVKVIVYGQSKPPEAPITPPALPLRPASTSVSRMPTPELRRLCADGLDELARRGELPPLPASPAAPVDPVAPVTPEAACDIVRGALADMAPDLLRRLAADTAAELQRRREALQAQLAALG